MIASWMLYTLAVSMLISIAGFAAAHALAARGRPTRFVWVASLVLSVAWPLAPMIAKLLPSPPKPVVVMPFTIVVDVSPTAAAAIDWSRLVDRGLLGAWVALSLFFAARILYGIAAIERTRGAWKRGRVNGVRVKLSDNVGPAVVGLKTMDVVLPEWILSLDESLREIVLRHEEEHRSARDPYLLFGAAVAVALLPWNAALWFQAKRLRLAIEMDCDARVLRSHPNPERYGMLILTIAQRRSVAPAMFAPMLSEPATNLERRILAMRTTTKKVARLTVYGGGIVAAGVLAFASSLQSATRVRPSVFMPKPVVRVPAVTPETIPVKPAPKAEKVDFVRVQRDTATVHRLEEVRVQPGYGTAGNAAPRYPATLKAAGTEGMAIARFNTDASGSPMTNTISIVSATHREFADAVVTVLGTWHTTPNASLQIPFVFVMADKSAKELDKLQGTLPAGSVVITGVPNAGPTPVSENQTYFEFQVEKPGTPVEGNPAPRYPDMLRSANVEGEVLAQFVLNADGTPDMDTFKVLKSTHELFTESVKSSLPNMRFHAATVGGKPVKQLIQMPFNFSLTKTP